MSDADSRRIRIRVPALTRVEGEGALELDLRAGRIESLRLRIYEPPRYFEKFLEGRQARELPDLVARICGICPVAYQMTAVHGVERLFGCDPGPRVRRLRRLLYCGEWIESHALHIHLLAAPDFLGVTSVAELARVAPDETRRGLALQQLGNRIIEVLGGRSVHPVGVVLGGFGHAPDPGAMPALAAELETAAEQARELVAWCAGLPLPEDAQDFVTVALRHPAEYPMNEGRICSSSGLDLDPTGFTEHVEEFQVPHSTALHALLDGQPYLVGPLARLNLNLDRLHPEARAALEATGLPWPSRNMFHSIVARAVEIHQAVLEARELVLEDCARTGNGEADGVYRQWRPRAGVAVWATEAPRGVLWHRYELDGHGRVVTARIVPPTAQNQARIEEDLRTSLTALGLDREPAELRQRAETVIRNYDPCISCATHFLRLDLERDGERIRVLAGARAPGGGG